MEDLEAEVKSDTEINMERYKLRLKLILLMVIWVLLMFFVGLIVYLQVKTDEPKDVRKTYFPFFGHE